MGYWVLGLGNRVNVWVLLIRDLREIAPGVEIIFSIISHYFGTIS
jgi:hypothetical protein